MSILNKDFDERYVVLDVETTGLDFQSGHKIIEIGCVELIDRRITGKIFHEYINPERSIDPEAIKIHGISNDFLNEKPKFIDIARNFFNFIKNSTLIIHNAKFDVGFINNEFKINNFLKNDINKYCKIIDTLKLAYSLFPGQRNNLDAICKRYKINNFDRTLHGALKDARILADAYLLMSGGQEKITFNKPINSGGTRKSSIKKIENKNNLKFKIISPTNDEIFAHEELLKFINTNK